MPGSPWKYRDKGQRLNNEIHCVLGHDVLTTLRLNLMCKAVSIKFFIEGDCLGGDCGREKVGDIRCDVIL